MLRCSGGAEQEGADNRAMVERMLKFTEREGVGPEKRPAAARRRDFREIHARFGPAAAAREAARCAQCGVPFCQNHCPLANDIPDWLALAAEGRFEEAWRLSAATNPMPEVCGRICPQDRLCESACTIEQSGHGTVTIGAVEEFLTEIAFENGWVAPLSPARRREGSVGIVGAGPAGLAAAERLRAAGFDVFVYDRYDRPGGLLVYGIPNFKLDKSVVARRVARLEEGGVVFVRGFELGRDAVLNDLRARHDAVLLAFGAYAARRLDCPVEAGAGVVAALDYLTASNRIGLGDQVSAFASGALDARGRRVVVIGGGDTAMDCVRTAVRQGAARVVCLYRRDRANMPGSAREVRHAEEEGVVFEWLAAPKAIGARAVLAERMRLGPTDASGRAAPAPAAGGDFALDADLVISALGFSPGDIRAICAEPALAVTAQGRLKVDGRTQATSIDGVFGAGDLARGAALVVWALKDGLAAAAAIEKRLEAIATRRAFSARPLLAAE
jgi:glutamate synthase (NADPH/NADH) small chain